jgi:AcrR family transcriptional regulator
MKNLPKQPSAVGRSKANLPSLAEPGDTKGKILDAAFRRLVQEGYAALSVREIAKDAGVNHALINYHFRTKDQLVIAVLEAANQRLLERQQRMYRSDAGFAEKWAQARQFYEDDLASGFVRVQAELFTASLSNPSLREKFLPQILAWKGVVLEGVRDALRALEQSGTRLPPPFTADAIACWISEFWLGMEFVNLLGTSPADSEHRAALDAMQTLLEQLDNRTRKHASSGLAERAVPSPERSKPSKRKRV